MGIAELVLTGVGLSMDAFAVAVCQGLCMPRLNWRHAAVIAWFFGGFQALMPALGWGMGYRFADRIRSVDHWVAFILLGIIGVNMLREALGPEEGEGEDTCAVTARLDLRRLLVLAVATSIDALAVGVTFAFLEVRILPAAALIGCTTFCLSLAGVAAGHCFGARYKRRAELSGGLILAALGTKILLEHLLAG